MYVWLDINQCLFIDKEEVEFNDAFYKVGEWHKTAKLILKIFIANIMREINTETSVVWPAWCYSGKFVFF